MDILKRGVFFPWRNLCQKRGVFFYILFFSDSKKCLWHLLVSSSNFSTFLSGYGFSSAPADQNKIGGCSQNVKIWDVLLESDQHCDRIRRISFIVINIWRKICFLRFLFKRVEYILLLNHWSSYVSNVRLFMYHEILKFFRSSLPLKSINYANVRNFTPNKNNNNHRTIFFFWFIIVI